MAPGSESDRSPPKICKQCKITRQQIERKEKLILLLKAYIQEKEKQPHCKVKLVPHQINSLRSKAFEDSVKVKKELSELVTSTKFNLRLQTKLEKKIEELSLSVDDKDAKLNLAEFQLKQLAASVKEKSEQIKTLEDKVKRLTKESCAGDIVPKRKRKLKDRPPDEGSSVVSESECPPAVAAAEFPHAGPSSGPGFVLTPASSTTSSSRVPENINSPGITWDSLSSVGSPLRDNLDSDPPPSATSHPGVGNESERKFFGIFESPDKTPPAEDGCDLDVSSVARNIFEVESTSICDPFGNSGESGGQSSKCDAEIERFAGDDQESTKDSVTPQKSVASADPTESVKSPELPSIFDIPSDSKQAGVRDTKTDTPESNQPESKVDSFEGCESTKNSVTPQKSHAPADTMESSNCLEIPSIFDVPSDNEQAVMCDSKTDEPELIIPETKENSPDDRDWFDADTCHSDGESDTDDLIIPPSSGPKSPNRTEESAACSQSEEDVKQNSSVSEAIDYVSPANCPNQDTSPKKTIPLSCFLESITIHSQSLQQESAQSLAEVSARPEDSEQCSLSKALSLSSSSESVNSSPSKSVCEPPPKPETPVRQNLSTESDPNKSRVFPSPDLRALLNSEVMEPLVSPIKSLRSSPATTPARKLAPKDGPRKTKKGSISPRIRESSRSPKKVGTPKKTPTKRTRTEGTIPAKESPYKALGLELTDDSDTEEEAPVGLRQTKTSKNNASPKCSRNQPHLVKSPKQSSPFRAKLDAISRERAAFSSTSADTRKESDAGGSASVAPQDARGIHGNSCDLVTDEPFIGKRVPRLSRECDAPSRVQQPSSCASSRTAGTVNKEVTDTSPLPTVEPSNSSCKKSVPTCSTPELPSVQTEPSKLPANKDKVCPKQDSNKSVVRDMQPKSSGPIPSPEFLGFDSDGSSETDAFAQWFKQTSTSPEIAAQHPIPTSIPLSTNPGTGILAFSALRLPKSFVPSEVTPFRAKDFPSFSDLKTSEKQPGWDPLGRLCVSLKLLSIAPSSSAGGSDSLDQENIMASKSSFSMHQDFLGPRNLSQRSFRHDNFSGYREPGKQYQSGNRNVISSQPIKIEEGESRLTCGKRLQPYGSIFTLGSSNNHSIDDYIDLRCPNDCQNEHCCGRKASQCCANRYSSAGSSVFSWNNQNPHHLSACWSKSSHLPKQNSIAYGNQLANQESTDASPKLPTAWSMDSGSKAPPNGSREHSSLQQAACKKLKLASPKFNNKTSSRARSPKKMINSGKSGANPSIHIQPKVPNVATAKPIAEALCNGVGIHEENITKSNVSSFESKLVKSHRKMESAIGSLSERFVSPKKRAPCVVHKSGDTFVKPESSLPSDETPTCGVSSHNAHGLKKTRQEKSTVETVPHVSPSTARSVPSEVAEAVLRPQATFFDTRKEHRTGVGAGDELPHRTHGECISSKTYNPATVPEVVLPTKPPSVMVGKSISRHPKVEHAHKLERKEAPLSPATLDVTEQVDQRGLFEPSDDKMHGAQAQSRVAPSSKHKEHAAPVFNCGTVEPAGLGQPNKNTTVNVNTKEPFVSNHHSLHNKPDGDIISPISTDKELVNSTPVDARIKDATEELIPEVIAKKKRIAHSSLRVVPSPSRLSVEQSPAKPSVKPLLNGRDESHAARGSSCELSLLRTSVSPRKAPFAPKVEKEGLPIQTENAGRSRKNKKKKKKDKKKGKEAEPAVPMTFKVPAGVGAHVCSSCKFTPQFCCCLVERMVREWRDLVTPLSPLCPSPVGREAESSPTAEPTALSEIGENCVASEILQSLESTVPENELPIIAARKEEVDKASTDTSDVVETSGSECPMIPARDDEQLCQEESASFAALELDPPGEEKEASTVVTLSKIDGVGPTEIKEIPSTETDTCGKSKSENHSEPSGMAASDAILPDPQIDNSNRGGILKVEDRLLETSCGHVEHSESGEAEDVVSAVASADGELGAEQSAHVDDSIVSDVGSTARCEEKMNDIASAVKRIRRSSSTSDTSIEDVEPVPKRRRKPVKHALTERVLRSRTVPVTPNKVQTSKAKPSSKKTSADSTEIITGKKRGRKPRGSENGDVKCGDNLNKTPKERPVRKSRRTRKMSAEQDDARSPASEIQSSTLEVNTTENNHLPGFDSAAQDVDSSRTPNGPTVEHEDTSSRRVQPVLPIDADVKTAERDGASKLPYSNPERVVVDLKEDEPEASRAPAVTTSKKGTPRSSQTTVKRESGDSNAWLESSDSEPEEASSTGPSESASKAVNYKTEPVVLCSAEESPEISRLVESTLESPCEKDIKPATKPDLSGWMSLRKSLVEEASQTKKAKRTSPPSKTPNRPIGKRKLFDHTGPAGDSKDVDPLKSAKEESLTESDPPSRDELREKPCGSESAGDSSTNDTAIVPPSSAFGSSWSEGPKPENVTHGINVVGSEIPPNCPGSSETKVECQPIANSYRSNAFQISSIGISRAVDITRPYTHANQRSQVLSHIGQFFGNRGAKLEDHKTEDATTKLEEAPKESAHIAEEAYHPGLSNYLPSSDPRTDSDVESDQEMVIDYNSGSEAPKAPLPAASASPYVAPTSFGFYSRNKESEDLDTVETPSTSCSSPPPQFSGFYSVHQSSISSESLATDAQSIRSSPIPQVSGFYSTEPSTSAESNVEPSRKLFSFCTDEKTICAPIPEEEIVPCCINIVGFAQHFRLSGDQARTIRPFRELTDELKQKLSNAIHKYIKNSDGDDSLKFLRTFLIQRKILPTQLSKMLCEILVDSTVKPHPTKEEAKGVPSYLSLTQKRTVLLIAELGRGNHQYFDFVLTVMEQFLSTNPTDQNQSLRKGTGYGNIASVYALICRTQGFLLRAQSFIFDLLYGRHLSYFQIIHRIISIFPPVMPYANPNNGPLTYTVAYLLMMQGIYKQIKDSELQSLGVSQLRNKLHHRYGYAFPKDLTRDHVVDELVKNIMTRGSDKAIVLLCKSQGFRWAHGVAQRHFFPFLNKVITGDERDDFKTARYITVLGEMSRGFAVSICATFVKKSLDLLQEILSLKPSVLVTESLISALVHFQRLDLQRVTAILCGWTPHDGKISLGCVKAAKRILAGKSPDYWKALSHVS